MKTETNENHASTSMNSNRSVPIKGNSGRHSDGRDDATAQREGSFDMRENTDDRKDSKGLGPKQAKSSKQGQGHNTYPKPRGGPYPSSRGGSYTAPPLYGYPGANSFAHQMLPNYAYPPIPSHLPPYNSGSFPSMSRNGPPGGFHPHGLPPATYLPTQGIYGPLPPSYSGISQYPHHQYGRSGPLYNSNESVISASSKSSKNSKKKRTIDGIHCDSRLPSSAYAFRRTDSTISSTSTTTAGNNTSTDTYLTEDSPHKRDRTDYPPLGTASMSFEDHDHAREKNHRRYHRRDFSTDASTTSSLSAGGFSLSSYDASRGQRGDVISGNVVKSSPKRHKGGRVDTLLVDTKMRPPSALGNDEANRFGQLSIYPPRLPLSSSSSTSADSKDQHLFLTLSTSPINAQNDIDQTPISKNTKKSMNVSPKNTSSIFKSKGTSKPQPTIESTSSNGVPSDTPTPPKHGEMDESLMADDLNHHLRGQSFTPLPHLSRLHGSDSAENSPNNVSSSAGIVQQLSWSITGDTPSLADLADWEDDRSKSGSNRPNSTTSIDSRHMMLSPHDFQLWKEENEMIERKMSGTTTPLPAFFSGYEGNENHKEDHVHPSLIGSARILTPTSRMGAHPGAWPKQFDSGLPSTPLFTSDYRDNTFSHSSHDELRHEQPMEFYNSFQYVHQGSQNDRIRNLRGRPSTTTQLPSMPLHVHPGMPLHLPMTSPMGLGPGKAGFWSPHGSMTHTLSSPHPMNSPMSSITQSKRNCVSLKPPIPSKFQGDMDKAKVVPVPEFTSLVNFPAHISQKQSSSLPEGMRCCVMCGSACPCTMGGKSKKVGSMSGSGGNDQRNNGQHLQNDGKNGFSIIPTQNKGLCTLCDVNVWIVVQSGLQIKWCKGCKNFRPWASFGDKGLATKCLRCRERQREKYALQKEEKEKTRTGNKHYKEIGDD